MDLQPLESEKHYARAEQLIAEGERVVQQISDAKDKRAMQRKVLSELRETDWEARGRYQREIAHLTERMDELGKKANGIWAQAHVHSTLATYRPERPRPRVAVPLRRDERRDAR